MPTPKRKTPVRKRPSTTLVMPTDAQVEEARQQAKSSPDISQAGVVYGLDTSKWAHYLVDVKADEGSTAAMREKLLSKGYVELEGGPHAVSGYQLGAYVFVIKTEQAAENFKKRAQVAQSRRI